MWGESGETPPGSLPNMTLSPQHRPSPKKSLHPKTRLPKSLHLGAKKMNFKLVGYTKPLLKEKLQPFKVRVFGQLINSKPKMVKSQLNPYSKKS